MATQTGKKPTRIKSTGSGPTGYTKITIFVESSLKPGDLTGQVEDMLSEWRYDYGYGNDISRYIVESNAITADEFNAEFAA